MTYWKFFREVILDFLVIGLVIRGLLDLILFLISLFSRT